MITPPSTASSSSTKTSANASTPMSTTTGPDEASRLLLRYDVVIIDEAHERTLNTDFLLGSLKSIQAERKRLTRASRAGAKVDVDVDNSEDQTVLLADPKRYRGYEMRELKLVVMSATIDAEKFSRFFNK